MTHHIHKISSPELTLRGFLLGAFITIIFTAANIYLGLKIGLTFASSIPAAIISMSLFRILGKSALLENNIVQTQASSAGTLSCIYVALPSLIMMGWWEDFPYVSCVLVTLAGGMTGVLFTIPLRRTLIANSDLPYPEGKACADILLASSPEGDKNQIRLLGLGGLYSALISFATSGLNILSTGFGGAVRITQMSLNFHGSFSLALIGTGYLVGIGGGMAMLGGVLLSWDVFVPLHQFIYPTTNTLQNPITDGHILWAQRIRFLGAGVIAISALWTLIKLFNPLIAGIKNSFQKRSLFYDDPTEHDLSPKTMLILYILLAITLFGLFLFFLWGHIPNTTILLSMSFLGVILCYGLGFLIASACGYMAGIIGSSSSPISGVSILAIMFISFLFYIFEKIGFFSPTYRPLLTAFSLFLLSVITASAAVSNDNLQDLKTGQLLGATAWKQEVALLMGCAIGALTIPFFLHLVYQVYGFAAHMPHANMDITYALPAPQAALMKKLSEGIINHNLDWTMLSLGAVLGVIMLFFDGFLQRFGMCFPPLAAGMGLYLPPQVSTTIAIGALIKWFFSKKENKNGIMLASGFIVGESMIGIILAAITALTGKTNLISYTPTAFIQSLLGWGCFISILWWFIKQLQKKEA